MTNLQDYFLELKTNFNECYYKLNENVNSENIHNLRKNLKKLKSFNIILDKLLIKDKDFPKKFSTLFKNIGEIRDIEIQLNILESYNSKYKKYLNNLYKQKINNIELNNNFDEEFEKLNNKLNKINDYHINNQIILNIKSYINSNIYEVNKMSKNISRKTLHKIRIKLKRIHYDIIMINESKDILKIDEIQDKIGLWHDYEITINNIKNFNNDKKIIKILSDNRKKLYTESAESIKQICTIVI